MQPVLDIIPDAALLDTPNESDVNDFFNILLSSKEFVPSSKPLKVPGGYVIRGQAQTDGDSLISLLDKSVGDLDAKLKYFYVADPVEKSFEEVQELEKKVEMGEATINDLETPLILITGPDLASDSNIVLQAFASLIGIINLFYFVATCFPDSVTMENAISLLIPIIALQFAHEVGHLVIMLKDKVNIE